MPTPAKPLFRPEALRPRLKTFSVPPAAAAARLKLGHWAGLLGSKEGEAMKETELLGDFLRDVFGDVLGYTGPAAGAERYTLRREKTIEVDGKFADAVLGRFRAAGGQATYVAALEGKGPRDPLDRPFAGRKLSAVDQALRYAVNVVCDWYLVTNLRETRLYHKGHDQLTYERFETRALADDDGAFRRFVFLLGEERVVPPAGGCHLDELLSESHRIGLDLTRDYYREYADLRRRTFEALCHHNPGVAPADLLAATEKVLDRVLFVAFCEDRGLLPAEIIARAYRHADPFNPRPIWDNFKGLFRAVDAGNRQLGIERYNGGLFAPDPLLDGGLAVPDEVCRGFDRLAAYYYGAPSATDGEPAEGEGRLIDVEILGHIFEQSISDLEEMRAALATSPLAPVLRGEGSKGAVAAQARGGVLHAAVHHALHHDRHAGAGPAGALRGPCAVATTTRPGRRRARRWPTPAPTTRPPSARRKGKRWSASGRRGSTNWPPSALPTRPAAAAPSSSRRSSSCTPPTRRRRPG